MRPLFLFELRGREKVTDKGDRRLMAGTAATTAGFWLFDCRSLLDCIYDRMMLVFQITGSNVMNYLSLD